MSVFYLTGLYLDFFPYLMITSELLWLFFFNISSTFVLEKAMPYVQIVRAFSSSVIALCKRLYLVPFDFEEMFLLSFAYCELF